MEKIGLGGVCHWCAEAVFYRSAAFCMQNKAG
jgi:hypothetical protein